MNDRLYSLGLAFAGLTLVFLTRLAWLQLVNGVRYAQGVDQSRVIAEILPPRRGRILDRTGTPIADTRAIYSCSVVFAELELQGRARRDLPFWRLGEHDFDSFLADLSGRVPTPAPDGNGRPRSLREVLVDAFSSHPGVALRSVSRQGETRLGLLALPRAALNAPEEAEPDGTGKENDRGFLAEGTLFSPDPRQALEREVAQTWGIEATLLYQTEFASACAALDRDFDLAGENAEGVMDAFAPAFDLNLPEAGRLRLRLLERTRRNQAELTLSRLSDEPLILVHERLERSLAQARLDPPPSTSLWAAAADGELIAPHLPRGQMMQEIPVDGVPGARERVYVIQGDPVDEEGLYTQLARRTAAQLGLLPGDLQSLLEKHARQVRAASCEREWRVHHLALDARRLDRLADALARELTTAGRPTTRMEVDQLLADARRLADREWHGQTRNDPMPIFYDVPQAFAARFVGRDSEPPRDLRRRFDDAEAEMPGLTVSLDVGRAYPFPGSCSHLLGTVGRSDDPGSGIAQAGRSGLERLHDERLRGIAGSRLRIRTPEGTRVLREERPVDGADIATEIDLEVQTVAEDSLSHYYELAQALGSATARMEEGRKRGLNRGGFALVDCHTGGLIVLASSPGFRLEDLASRYDQLLKDPAQPLVDHAVVPESPAGSSFKIATALACLKYGSVSPGEVLHCKGYMAMSRGRPVIRDHAPPGDYDLVTAIQMSSNVYFATIAARLGPDRLTEVAGLLGIGERNALDVPHQPRPSSPNRWLPRPSAIAITRPAEPRWFPSDTWRMGMGQFSIASPLQVVPLAAAVANGGHVVRPFLVRPERQPELLDLQIRKDWLDQARRGMELVTSNEPHSTARLLVLEGRSAGIKVAAKTGTAEWGDKKFDHAWMIGYAPADNPTVAFACFIHCGTFGGQACTPVVKRVLETYFGKYGRAGHQEAVRPAEPARGSEPEEEEEIKG